MITGKIKIKNKVGLHARPASLFVKEAKKYDSTIRVKYDDRDINGKSILEVLSIGARHGSEIEIIIQGAEEKIAYEALKNLVDSFEE